jgi:hypothetical protein
MKSPRSETIKQPLAASRRLTDPVKPTGAHHTESKRGSSSPHPTNVPLPKKAVPPKAKRKDSA